MILYLLEKMVAIIKYVNIECPYCHSMNTSKISTVNRMTSAAMFGLASSKIGKTHKCNDCDSTW